MKPEHCREWQESLGAYALGQLPPEELPGLEAHLEGCAECRAELDSLASIALLLPLADPDRVANAPLPPPALAERIFDAIAGERRVERKRRLRFRLSLSGVTAAAAAAAAVLAIFVFSGGNGGAPARHVDFASLPNKLEIGATLEPRGFGTEIHMYVNGAPSGALCRVFLEARNGSRLAAGSFRYRWGEDYPVMSSALDLSRTEAIGIQVGKRTFVAPISSTDSTASGGHQPEEATT